MERGVSSPALAAAVAAYLLIGVGLVAWYVRQLPASEFPLDRTDRVLLAVYVVFWPLVLAWVLLDVLSKSLFP